MHSLFLSQGRHTYIEGVERLTDFDLRFLTGSTAKADDPHDKVGIVGQLLIDEFLVDLWPVTEMDAERCLIVDVTHQVLIEFFCYEGHERRQQSDERCQALV